MTVPDARTRRPQRPQIVLEVLERIQLTPHLVRIVAGGPGISAVEDKGFTDAYTKMLFAHPETDLAPPYDLAALRERLPVELLPSVRTYTIRRFDLANGRIWIDFVVHGSEGVAGPWADAAGPGQPVVLRGIGGGYAPDPEADWHLLAGDDSALPAIAAALEAAPSDAEGVVLLEVDGDADHVELAAPDGIRVEWLHRDGREAGTTTLLADAVRALEWRGGRVHVFAHGERGAMKSLRPYLTDERALDRSQLSLSAYWAHGRREDTFQAEKREPVGQI
ncbi:siderophore-interacting protein [Microbacterium betulae]|uniref:Siderophore-interacting protein n=1 Tax=Microbacterium betulae TaxID=2981139 RepID=A0AA97I4D7_9MICO|nr:siderophore-interacting protein [Microbacterium sp. AB]WOF22501.1 siderophore-interacting protein [Microbacterium sp. AB]